MVRYPVRPGVPTENGWPMVNANKCVSVEVVAAAKKVPLLRGDVATILNAWIILYNREVEPIKSQVWGWSPDNDVANSNHMSGTAIDINAPFYPWGKRVMNEATKSKVRSLLAKFNGVVFWGADWARADEMHYQIGLSPNDSRVRALAEKLNNGYLNAYAVTNVSRETSPKGATMERSKDDLILDQLAGYPHEDWTGWEQLGGLTLVNAVATIGHKLGIDGFKDMRK